MIRSIAEVHADFLLTTVSFSVDIESVQLRKRRENTRRYLGKALEHRVFDKHVKSERRVERRSHQRDHVQRAVQRPGAFLRNVVFSCRARPSVQQPFVRRRLLRREPRHLVRTLFVAVADFNDFTTTTCVGKPRAYGRIFPQLRKFIMPYHCGF